MLHAGKQFSVNDNGWSGQELNFQCAVPQFLVFSTFKKSQLEIKNFKKLR